MNYLGDYPTSSIVYVYFHTFSSVGASVTLTGLAVTDIEIYKNGSTTQRSSDNGYTLLDTDGIDFDGATGVHGFSIDTSDNSDSGFFAAGGEYMIMVNAVTIDSQTVRFIAATFSIERTGGVLALLKGANGVAAIKADTAAILIDTGTTLDGRIPAALVGGRMDVSVGAMAAGVVTAAAFATGAIDADAIADGAIDAGAIADGAITAAKIATGAIDADALAADAVTEIASGVAGNGLLASGTAQAGAASSITLQSDEDATADIFNLNIIRLTGGTGAGQSRQIIDYSTGRVATVNEPWIVVPDATTTYDIVEGGLAAATLEEVEDAVWDADPADHVGVDTFGGEGVPSDVVKISGNANAADNLEAILAGGPVALAADVQFVNGIEVIGDGSDQSPWRAIGT